MAKTFCLCCCSLVIIGEVVFYLIRNFLGHVLMMEEFEDGFCLFNLNTEKLTVGIDTLR